MFGLGVGPVVLCIRCRSSCPLIQRPLIFISHACRRGSVQSENCERLWTKTTPTLGFHWDSWLGYLLYLQVTHRATHVPWLVAQHVYSALWKASDLSYRMCHAQTMHHALELRHLRCFCSDSSASLLLCKRDEYRYQCCARHCMLYCPLSGPLIAPMWTFDAILDMLHGDSIFDYRSVSSSSLPIYLCHGDRYWYHQCNLVERHSHRYDAATYRSRLMNTGAQWSTHCKSHLLMPLPSGCKRFFVGRACLTTCSAVGSS